MKRKSFAGMECSVARTLEVVGEWWSLLILRDAMRGRRRFEEFQDSLGIARNILSRRLKRLVADGLLEKRVYSERPRRYEYRLTDKSRDLFPVIVALMDWGNRWAAPAKGPAMRLIDRATGEPIEPALIDRTTARPVTLRSVGLAPGPGAGRETRAFFASLARHKDAP